MHEEMDAKLNSISDMELCKQSNKRQEVCASLKRTAETLEEND